MERKRYSLRTILFPLLLAVGICGGVLFGNYIGRNSSAFQLRGLIQQMAFSQNKLTHTLGLIER